jgi:hypothetical protein
VLMEWVMLFQPVGRVGDFGDHSSCDNRFEFLIKILFLLNSGLGKR